MSTKRTYHIGGAAVPRVVSKSEGEESVLVSKTNPTSLFDPNVEDDKAVINAAIDYAISKGIYEVIVEGEYTSTTPIIAKSNIHLNVLPNSILKNCLKFGDVIHNDEDEPITDFKLTATIDVNNTYRGTGLKLYNFNDVELNVRVYNVTNGNGWGVFLGVKDADTSDFICKNIKGSIEVDGHDGTLESVLIFNTHHANLDIVCKNKTNGPTIGLWQKVEHSNIKAYMNNCATVGLYYSYSCNNLWLDVTGEDCYSLVSGANQSDHGNFGYDRCRNINIKVSGTGIGAAAPSAVAVTIGSIDGGKVEIGSLTNFGIALNINEGKSSATKFFTRNVDFYLGGIHENNPTSIHHRIHSGILISNAIEKANLNFYGGTLQGDENQRYPVTFSQGIADGVNFYGTQLIPYSNNQEHIYLEAGTVLGAVKVTGHHGEITFGQEHFFVDSYREGFGLPHRYMAVGGLWLDTITNTKKIKKGLEYPYFLNEDLPFTSIITLNDNGDVSTKLYTEIGLTIYYIYDSKEGYLVDKTDEIDGEGNAIGNLLHFHYDENGNIISKGYAIKI